MENSIRKRRAGKPIPERPLTRLEKVNAVQSTQRVERFKSIVTSKPFWVVFGVLASIGSINFVVKPWFQRNRMRRAEEESELLWNKVDKDR